MNIVHNFTIDMKYLSSLYLNAKYYIIFLWVLKYQPIEFVLLKVLITSLTLYEHIDNLNAP